MSYAAFICSGDVSATYDCLQVLPTQRSVAIYASIVIVVTQPGGQGQRAKAKGHEKKSAGLVEDKKAL